tara:strand:- start:613 stop:1014 length:402 start_codon:yes stop_codon:yes gene_type:complete
MYLMTLVIKVSFLLISILSLSYGLIFLIIPDWFVEITMAKSINVAWLRNIGSSIVGLLFFGCLAIYYKPKGKFLLFRIITITSILQTISLIYSRFYNEFSAQNLILIDFTIYLAIFVSIYFAWIGIYKAKIFK